MYVTKIRHWSIYKRPVTSLILDEVGGLLVTTLTSLESIGTRNCTFPCWFVWKLWHTTTWRFIGDETFQLVERGIPVFFCAIKYRVVHRKLDRHSKLQNCYKNNSFLNMAAVYVGQTQGTVRPANPFNPEEDAKRLRKAMKGFGKLSVCSASPFTMLLCCMCRTAWMGHYYVCGPMLPSSSVYIGQIQWRTE